MVVTKYPPFPDHCQKCEEGCYRRLSESPGKITLKCGRAVCGHELTLDTQTIEATVIPMPAKPPSSLSKADFETFYYRSTEQMRSGLMMGERAFERRAGIKWDSYEDCFVWDDEE